MYNITCKSHFSVAYVDDVLQGQDITPLLPKEETPIDTGKFPDLSKHNNWMAKCLSIKTYLRLKEVKTPGGVTIENIIRTGVENPGHPFIMTVGMFRLVL